MKLTIQKGILSIIFLLLLVMPALPVKATDSIDVAAGQIYYAELNGRMDTLRWTGLRIHHTAVPLSDSKFPFLTGYSASFPGVVTVNFPGYNLNDGKHYYAVMFADQFDILNVENIQASDLEANGLFSSSNFPTFYPSYYSFSDNPKQTFTVGSLDTVTINGVDFPAYNVTLGNGISYYLLKYNYLGEDIPLFLVRLGDATCVGGDSCKGEFMLPVSNRDYNFFVLSELPLFNFEIKIDSVPTDHFQQTAWAYIFWLRATDFYSGLPAPVGTNIFVREQNGNDLFIPFKLAGYDSEATTIGQTDTNGEVNFIIAPTIYPPIQNYNITVGAIVDGVETSETDLYVDKFSPMDYTSKPLAPATLYDNVKRAVNGLDSISNTLFTWQNPPSGSSHTKDFTIVYDTIYNNFTIAQTGWTGSDLRTGAPNKIILNVESGGIPQSGYMVEVKESDGYLVSSPYTSSTPFDSTTRTNEELIPQSTTFIITPTNYGSINSQVTLAILDSGGNYINNVTLTIDSNLERQSGEGVVFSDDDLKKGINSIDQVIKSLFTTLNY